MGYFSNYTPDSNPTGLFERSVCGYPSRLETLNYYTPNMTDVSIPQDAIATMKCCGQNRFLYRTSLRLLRRCRSL